MGQHVLDGAPYIALHFVYPHGHHHLAGLVGRFRRFPVIQVGRERHEALGGKSIRQIFDVRHEAPVLLNDDKGRPFLSRPRQVPRGRLAV